MNYQKLAKRIAAVTMGIAMMGAVSVPALAGETGANITQQTIPVRAEIDSYYIISTPANLDASGAINLTRDNNAYVTSDGDTNGTFYGYTTVGVQGVVATGKHVHVDLHCADLVKTGEASTKASVGMKNLSTDDGTKVAAIWAASDASVKESNAVGFGSTAWTAGTTGIDMNFASNTINTTTDAVQYAMLRTTLPVDGQYTSALVLDFSVAAD